MIDIKKQKFDYLLCCIINIIVSSWKIYFCWWLILQLNYDKLNLLNICQNVTRTIEIEKKYEKKSTERNRTNIEEIENIKIKIFENTITKTAVKKMKKKKWKKKLANFMQQYSITRWTI